MAGVAPSIVAAAAASAAVGMNDGQTTPQRMQFDSLSIYWSFVPSVFMQVHVGSWARSVGCCARAGWRGC